ncbi:oligosaccharide flippase family protein [Megamonas hypermegale]|uniref:oligosaccharide flippase family protein n=1 Tax=Megamonas hypermegale TaxID=158847 RepID=UPI0025A383CC|nr:oligosaccharide flippase family protein [Megamonas hypermegale]MDM8144313.1 oligosaccharide flippase family protein [Megamonas hypermegale]
MNERKIGILISYVNIVLHAVIGFLYVPILLYYIGKSEYGLYQLIGSFIAYFSIMDFGLTAAVVRFYTKYKALNDKVNMENILAISLRCYSVITVLLFVIGYVCYINLDKFFAHSMTAGEISSAENLFLLLLLNIVLTISTMIFRAVINAYEKFLFLKGLETVQLVLQPILIILVLQEYPSAFTVALVQTVLNIGLIVSRIYYCFFKLKITIKFHHWDKKLFKEFKKLALSVFAVTLIDQVFFKTNQVILGIISGTSAVAVYSIASLIYMNYMALSLAISGVYLPHITEMIAKREPIQKISELFIQIGRWQYFLLAAVASGFIVFGRQFIEIWAGYGFEDAYWITLLIIIPFTVDLIQNIGLAVLQAQNKYDFRARVYFCMGIFNLCLAIPLGLKYGGIGCAFATGLSMFIGNGLIMNWYYLKIMGLNIALFWKNIVKISIGVVIFTIIAYGVNTITFNQNNLVFVIKLVVYALIYITMMYKFLMNADEKEKVRKIVCRFR